MKVYMIESETVVQAPLGEVFAYFSCPENLEALTPEKLSFSILTPSPVPMHVGSIIHYSLRLGPFPFTWVTAICDFVPNKQFVDVMLSGPYKLWHHTHTFAKTKNGTKVIDKVVYALPFGVLGELIHRLKVEKDLEEIFSYREKKIIEVFN